MPAQLDHADGRSRQGGRRSAPLDWHPGHSESPSAKHLYVFQRTPSSVDVRNNRPTDPEFAKTLEPGWQRKRRDNFTLLTSGGRAAEDVVGDAWTDIVRNVGAIAGGDNEKPDPVEIQKAQLRRMEQTRQRVASTVKDPATAEALKPYYHYFCKRPGFHDSYLPTFNRPNVTLVDTKGKGVERITPKGVIVDGKEYPLDLLVYATGFDFMTEYSKESGVEVIGPGGQPLDKHWDTGARTLYGLQTHGFPNFFLMSLIQAGVSVNYVHIADEQTKHIAFIISECLKRGIGDIQPTQEAEDAWVGSRVERRRSPRLHRVLHAERVQCRGQARPCGRIERPLCQGPDGLHQAARGLARER